MTEEEKLLFEIIDCFQEHFGKRAILRGGMVLRLLGCERFTNDADYTFVPHKSKKEVVDEVLKALKTLPGVSLQHSLNSKCLRIKLQRESIAVQVEIKVAEKETVMVVSNKPLADQMGLPARLLPVVDLSVALADKLAAWNERRLPRDLYDIHFFLRMGIRPNPDRLEKRLIKPQYSRLVKKDAYFTGRSIEEFYSFLREAVQRIPEDEIVGPLADSLPAEELAGLVWRIRAELAKL